MLCQTDKQKLEIFPKLTDKEFLGLGCVVVHCIISNLSFFSRCKYKEVKTSNSAIMIVLMRLFQFKTDFQTPGLTRTQYRAGELFWLCLDTKSST